MVLRVVVMTPERVEVREWSHEISLPGTNGMVGILEKHAPFFTVLECGLMKVRCLQQQVDGAEWQGFILFGGFVEIARDRVKIVTSNIERLQGGRSEADALLRKAEEKLEMATTPEEKKAGLVEIRLAKMRVEASRFGFS
jgi:ATP synthase F1 epsilon subunit